MYIYIHTSTTTKPKSSNYIYIYSHINKHHTNKPAPWLRILAPPFLHLDPVPNLLGRGPRLGHRHVGRNRRSDIKVGIHFCIYMNTCTCIAAYRTNDRTSQPPSLLANPQPTYKHETPQTQTQTAPPTPSVSLSYAGAAPGSAPPGCSSALLTPICAPWPSTSSYGT